VTPASGRAAAHRCPPAAGFVLSRVHACSDSANARTRAVHSGRRPACHSMRVKSEESGRVADQRFSRHTRQYAAVSDMVCVCMIDK